MLNLETNLKLRYVKEMMHPKHKYHDRFQQSTILDNLGGKP